MGRTFARTHRKLFAGALTLSILGVCGLFVEIRSTKSAVSGTVHIGGDQYAAHDKAIADAVAATKAELTAAHDKALADALAAAEAAHAKAIVDAVAAATARHVQVASGASARSLQRLLDAWLPTRSALPLSSLQQGILSMGDVLRWVPFYGKLEAGQPVRMQAIGSSFTYGGGGSILRGEEKARLSPSVVCYPNEAAMRGYFGRVLEAIQAVWPHEGHRMYNSGWGGVTLSSRSLCLQQLIVPSCDVYIFEAGVLIGDPDVRAGLEAAIRYLHATEPDAVVVVWGGFAFCGVDACGFDPVSLEHTPFSYDTLNPLYENPVRFGTNDEFEVLAHFYGLAHVSVRDALFHYTAQRRPGSSFVELFENVGDPGVHLASPFSQQAQADVLIFFLLRMYEAAASNLTHFARTRDVSARLDFPSKPLIPAAGAFPLWSQCYNWMLGRPGELFLHAFHEPPIHSIDGFNVTDSVSPRGEHRVALAASAAGAFVVFNLTWDVAAIASLCSPATRCERRVTLSYLMSYEHMGIAAMTCVAPCVCNETLMNAHTSDGGHISIEKLGTVTLTDGPEAFCYVRVAVGAATDSDGHRFVIRRVLTTLTYAPSK